MIAKHKKFKSVVLGARKYKCGRWYDVGRQIRRIYFQKFWVTKKFLILRHNVMLKRNIDYTNISRIFKYQINLKTINV